MIWSLQQFDDFLNGEVAAKGLEKEPPFEPAYLEQMFVNLAGTLDSYWGACNTGGGPFGDDVVQRVFWLRTMATRAQRYLEWAKLCPAEFPGRIAAAIQLYEQAASELRTRGRLKNFVLKKLMPSKTAAGAKPASRWAAQNWDKIRKIHNSQGGKKLLDEYWLEVFDPHHRPPHAVGRGDALFRGWLRLVSPYELDLMGRETDEPNPEYDPSYRQSFFDYLDKTNNLPPPQEAYAYLTKADRDYCQVVMKGGRIVRKRGGQELDTTRWENDNGNKMGKFYEGAGQSMVKDHGIWVMSPEDNFYTTPQIMRNAAGDKIGGQRHHSALLAGGAIKGGGEWMVRGGSLKVISGDSGHYQPNFAQFQDVLRTLEAKSIDLNSVAAQWDSRNDLTFFNAKELSDHRVQADWNGWPKYDGARPLRPVRPLSPDTLSAQGIPGGVSGAKTPYEGRYLKPALGAQGQKKLDPARTAAFK